MKTINTCYSLFIPIESPELSSIKKYLQQNLGSIYGVEPHITLCFMPLSREKLGNASRVVDEYLLHVQEFFITINTDIKIDKTNNFIYLQIYSEECVKIHQDVTRSINKFRQEYIREKDQIRLNTEYYDKESKKNIIQYGYSRVFNRYTAHITLGKIEQGRKIDDFLLNTIRSRIKNLEKGYKVKQLVAMFHTDESNQVNIKAQWMKKYILNP